MNITAYDILSNIIPGILIFIAITFNDSTYSFDGIVIIAISYFLGYLNNSLSSWFEGILYVSWGGRPSSRLLDGNQIWKVSFYEWEKAKAYLKKECLKEKPTNDELFHIAMRKANMTGNTRIKDFNQQYAFSRSILMCFLIVAILVNFKFWFNLQLSMISLVIIIMLWMRAKQRAYYFSREILNIYLSTKIK